MLCHSLGKHILQLLLQSENKSIRIKLHSNQIHLILYLNSVSYLQNLHHNFVQNTLANKNYSISDSPLANALLKNS